MKCALCGREEKERYKLHRHHIDNNRKNNDGSNLVFLCWECHRGIHRYNRPRKPKKDEVIVKRKELETLLTEAEAALDEIHALQADMKNARDLKN